MCLRRITRVAFWLHNGETDRATIMMEIYDRAQQYMMQREYIIYTASA
jgi:hypothetical protein